MYKYSGVVGKTIDSKVKLRREQFRLAARSARAAMPQALRAHKSVDLCRQLVIALDLTLCAVPGNPSEGVVALYAAFPLELDLSDFIAVAYARGLRVAFPCMVLDALSICDVAQTMEMREVAQTQQAPFVTQPLRRFQHDSKELQAFPYVAANELSMLVVPVVGFDACGNRLGYGKGNYDRYLAQITSDCCVVGVAFAEQQLEAIPPEPHDVALSLLVV